MLEHLDKQHRSEVTLKLYSSKAGHLVRLLGKTRDVSTITEADTLEYWKKRSRPEEGSPSAHTVQKELRVLVQAIRYCERAGLCTAASQHLMPKELAQGKVYHPRERWLPRDEFAALLLQLTAERRDYVVAYTNTGLRLSELTKTTAHDLDEAAQELTVHGTKTRTSRRRVPLNADALEVFVRRAEKHKTGPLFPEWGKIQRDLKAACRRADIAPVSPNDLRRTFASWMAQAGVSPLVTARIMGHASTAMVERVYAHLSREALHEAVGKLDKKATRKRPSRKRRV